jgi:hypothetical protein
MRTRYWSENLKGRQRSLEKRSRRWEDNIRMDPRETGWEGVDWMHLAQERNQWRDLLNTVMNLRISLEAGNFLMSSVTVSFSRRTLLHGVS